MHTGLQRETIHGLMNDYFLVLLLFIESLLCLGNFLELIIRHPSSVRIHQKRSILPAFRSHHHMGRSLSTKTPGCFFKKYISVDVVKFSVSPSKFTLAILRPNFKSFYDAMVPQATFEALQFPEL